MWPVALVGSGVALALLSSRGPTNTTQVRSMSDGNTYHVQNLPDKQNACELMSKIRGNLEKLIELDLCYNLLINFIKTDRQIKNIYLKHIQIYIYMYLCCCIIHLCIWLSLFIVFFII